MGVLEQVIRIYRDAGFGAEDSAKFFRAFSYFINGATLDEALGYESGPGAPEPMTDQEIQERFPAVAAAGEFFGPETYDAIFELGLDVLVKHAERTRSEQARRRR